MPPPPPRARSASSASTSDARPSATPTTSSLSNRRHCKAAPPGGRCIQALPPCVWKRSDSARRDFTSRPMVSLRSSWRISSPTSSSSRSSSSSSSSPPCSSSCSSSSSSSSSCFFSPSSLCARGARSTSFASSSSLPSPFSSSFDSAFALRLALALPPPGASTSGGFSSSACPFDPTIMAVIAAWARALVSPGAASLKVAAPPVAARSCATSASSSATRFAWSLKRLLYRCTACPSLMLTGLRIAS